MLPTASVGIRAGFSCSFPNMISHGRSTSYEGRISLFNCGGQSYVRSYGELITTTSGLTAKFDNRNNNNNRNYNNINNQNRGGEPIRVRDGNN